jgi:hypothetical protein
MHTEKDRRNTSQILMTIHALHSFQPNKALTLIEASFTFRLFTKLPFQFSLSFSFIE